MREVLTFGQIKDGILKITKRDEFQRNLTAMEDCRVLVSVKKLYRNRSTHQNAYYWGVVILMFVEGVKDTWGEDIDKETAHYILREKCNATEHYIESTGELVRIAKETHTLTTVEFEEYLDRCRKLMFEYFGVEVPLPNEQTNFYKELTLTE